MLNESKIIKNNIWQNGNLFNSTTITPYLRKLRLNLDKALNFWRKLTMAEGISA